MADVSAAADPGPSSWGTARPPARLFALKLYLFLFFATVGLTEPYLNLHLRRLGLSGAQIGALAAILPAVAALAPFAWTAWADATGRARAVFVWNTWLAGPCFVPVLLSASFPLLAAALTAFALMKTPLVPLANSLAFQALGAGREGYGHVRLWGSVGYIAAALAGGALVDRMGARSVLGAVVALLAACGIVASSALGRGAPAAPARLGAGLTALFSLPAFRRFLGAAFVARVSAGPYNTFFGIQLEELGISQTVAGRAWAAGVGCEVAVMVAWPRLAGRCRPETLLAAAVAAHTVRWGLMAQVTHPVALVAIQLLHGLTFGAFYLASVQMTDEMVRPELRATGQGLYTAWVFGAGGVVGNLAGGWLFDRMPLADVYRLSALVALGATALCLRLRSPGPRAA